MGVIAERRPRPCSAAINAVLRPDIRRRTAVWPAELRSYGRTRLCPKRILAQRNSVHTQEGISAGQLRRRSVNSAAVRKARKLVAREARIDRPKSGSAIDEFEEAE